MVIAAVVDDCMTVMDNDRDFSGLRMMNPMREGNRAC